jgi:hypothetical protein
MRENIFTKIKIRMVLAKLGLMLVNAMTTHEFLAKHFFEVNLKKKIFSFFNFFFHIKFNSKSNCDGWLKVQM